MSTGNKNSNIPNSSNLLDISNQMLDGVKNMTNTLLDISKIISQISDSKLAKGNVSKSLNKVSKNLVSSIQIITGTLSQINSISMGFKLENAIQSFVTNPVGFIKNFKSGEPIKLTNQSGIFEQYAFMAQMLSNVAGSMNGIKKKSIRKSSKYIITIFKGLVKVYKYIDRKSKRLKPLSAMAEKFLESLPHIWNLIIMSQDSAKEFIEKQEILKPKTINKNLKEFFKTYIFLILQAAQLGSVILSGSGSIDYKFLGIKKVKDFKISRNDLIVGLTTAAALSGYLTILAKVSAPMFDSFVKISDNRKSIKKGIIQFFTTYMDVLFFIKDLLKHTPEKSTLKRLTKMLKITAMLSAIFLASSIMFGGLIILGKNKRMVIKGLRTFKIIFLGKERGKLGKKLGLSDTSGLIDIIKEIKITKTVEEHTKKLIKFCLVMSGVFILISIMTYPITLLAVSGKIFKKGLNVFHQSILKMIEIINDENIKKLKLSEILISCRIMAIMIVSFIAITIPLQILGLMAPLAVLSIITLLSIRVAVHMMIKILAYVGKYPNIISKNSPILIALTAGFAGAGKLMAELGKSYIWTITAIITLLMMRLSVKIMIRTLAYINKYSNIITKGAPLMTAVLGCYKEWGEILEKLGKDYKVTLIAVGLALLVLGLMAASIGVMVLIDKLKAQASKGLLLSLAISASILLIAGSLFLVSKTIAGIDFKNILAFMVVVGIVFASYAILGIIATSLMPYLLPAFIVIMTICISLRKLAKDAKKIQKLDLDEEKIKTNIHAMIFALVDPLTELNGKQWINLIRAKRKLRTLKKISRIIYRIARRVRNMANLKIDDGEGHVMNMSPDDFVRSTANAQAAISSLINIFIEPDGSPSTVMTQLDGISNHTVKQIRKLKRITRILGRIANLVSNMAGMKMPDPTKGFDSIGNPKGWIQMTNDSYQSVITTGKNMITSLLGIFFETKDSGGNLTLTTNPSDVMLALDGISSHTVKQMRKLKRITRNLGVMAKLVSNMSAMKMPDSSKGFDEIGNPKGWILMNDDSYQAVIATGKKMITSLLGIFVETDSSGKLTSNPSDVMLALDNISGKMVRKMRKLKRITRIIGKIASLVSKMSVLVVPDPEKGFDEEGKPLGWIQLQNGFDKQVVKTGEDMVSSILSIFVDPKTGEFTQVWQNLDKIKSGIFKKMLVFNGIVGSLSKITDTIIKIKGTFIPSKWDKEGKPIEYMHLTEDDFTGASDTIIKIMSSLFNAIGSPEITNLINNFDKHKSKQSKSLFSLMDPIIGMVNAVISLAGGQVPEYDKDGHPTGKAVSISSILNGPDKDKLIENIKTLYTIFTDVSNFILGNENGVENQSLKSLLIKKAKSTINKSSTEDANKIIKNITDPVVKLVSPFTTISRSLSGINVNETNEALKNLAVGSMSVVGLITDPEFDTIKFIRIDNKPDTPAGHAINFIARSIYQNVNGANIVQRTQSWKSATDDSVKLIKSINTLDVTKANSLKDLMHELYNFSSSIQGDFDKLAEVINEKLVSVLEKLTGTMNDLNNKSFEVPDLKQETAKIPRVTESTDKGENKPKQENQKKPDLSGIMADISELKDAIRSLVRCVDQSAGVIRTQEQ